MKHILVLPEEFQENLTDAYNNLDARGKWTEIGVNSADEMLPKIIELLNQKYPKLNIEEHRFESKNQIRDVIGNKGNSSVYAGYFEKENGTIDGLFFFIPSLLDSGNDFLTRQVNPSLIGIYEGVSEMTKDLHFNNRPVYILNLNVTSRSEQRSVKISIICAILLGYNYLDVFERPYFDIVEGNNQINTLQEFNALFSNNGDNELFEINEHDKILKLLASKVTTSANPSAEIYRYFLKVLPAIYFAANQNFKIDIEDFSDVQMNMLDTIKAYIAKLQ